MLAAAGLINLSSLNGMNGFKLDGENTNDWSGYPVTKAGDINGDGYDDLMISALCYPEGLLKGRSYVVFGGPDLGKSGIFNLSSLTGSNGFKLDGENNGDYVLFSTPYFLSALGDINGDQHDDLIIGAYGYPQSNGQGRSYVIFGGPGVGNSGLLNLSSLNGVNGFKLDGEYNGDYSGIFVSGAGGDINRDGHPDLVIGAFGYPQGIGRGRSYVVFGGTQLGSSGLINLASLNGTNGFKLDGENLGDLSGCSGNIMGDINGDGYDDLIIGACGYPNGVSRGRSYVVFGDPQLGSSGLIDLGSLNGANGFKLDGENNQDFSSLLTGMSGDINGDGYDDVIIGAFGYPAGDNKGRTYVVFGGPAVGRSGIFNLSSLTGVNGFILEGENNGDTSGWPLNVAGDINGDGLPDLIVGARQYSKGRGRTYVVFGDVPPVLVNNSLSLYANETVLIKSSDLAAYDRNHDNNTLVFFPSHIIHGQFELIGDSGKALANFTQQQITAGDIQFVSDGATEAPGYNISVFTPGIAYASPTSANITLNFLQIKNNQLLINQGQTVLLTTENLSATDNGSQKQDIKFFISDLQHGQFQWINISNQPILIFNQQNITDSVVVFVHDGSTNAPAYRVAINNGRVTTSPQSARIDFDANPILINNTLIINQGQQMILDSACLGAIHTTGPASALMFNISEVQHGQFSWGKSPNQIISCFYQQNVTTHLEDRCAGGSDRMHSDHLPHFFCFHGWMEDSWDGSGYGLVMYILQLFIQHLSRLLLSQVVCNGLSRHPARLACHQSIP